MSELSAPLARRSDRQRASRTAALAGLKLRLPVARIGAGLLALVGIAVVGWTVLVDDPEGGRPSTATEIAAARPVNVIVGNTATPGPTPSIVVGEQVPVVSDSFVTLEDPVPLGLAGLIPDLVEQTEYGPIPRMANTGLRPFDAYARPASTPATSNGKPLVAIVVSGLGLNHDGTLEAIGRLPDAVTLAFAPYGRSLEETVSAARVEGHEIFLEVPLEPFDYPENDPGPDTLLTGQPPRDNLARLFKVMARFGGYVGILNNMGARFTASGADFAPVMEELAASGLGYLDDGSSNRSLAPQLAEANRVPFGRVDRMLDLDPARGAIIEELDALVALAREKGSAIGIVSALPVSINTITEWANGLDGVELVPASALMRSPDA